VRLRACGVGCAVAGMRCAWHVCGVRCGVAGISCAVRAHQNVLLYVEYVLSMGLHIHGYVVCCQSTPARITCSTHAERTRYSSTHHARTTILILTHARARECACARLCPCIYTSMYLYTYIVHAHTHRQTHTQIHTNTPQSPKHSTLHRAKSPNQRPGTGVGE
jgi:hypothetical protein